MNRIVLISASAVLLLLLVAASGAAFYFYREAQNMKVAADTESERNELIALVGKHIVLPSDEVPTIATVSDPERLKDQPFFAKAKAGDKALIYTGARKAYLYDPVADRLVDVAPVSIGVGTSPEPASAP
jgi:hypothetical protein